MSESDLAVIMAELRHIKADVKEVKALQKVANGRTTKLEHFRTLLSGMWIATALIVSVAWAVLRFFV